MSPCNGYDVNVNFSLDTQFKVSILNYGRVKAICEALNDRFLKPYPLSYLGSLPSSHRLSRSLEMQ